MTAVTAMPGQYVIKRLPQTDDELWWTIFALWGYRIPRTAVCPGHIAPFTALANAYFNRYPNMVWKASRGLGGKSRTLAILSLTEATLLGSEVSLLGGSAQQSMNVHEATKLAWDWHAAPKKLLVQEPTRFTTQLKNGGKLNTLTASTRSARGLHPPRLRMDEIDEMDQFILDSALGQPMEQTNYLGDVIPPQVVMSSTHHYPDKAMSEMIRRASQQGWPVYEWCFRESANPVDGWLSQKGIDFARSVVSQAMWEAEYELQEPSFGGRAIDTDAVDRAFDEALGTFPGDKMVYIPREEGRHYLTSVDWAKSVDRTIITTFDTTELPWRCVAWQAVAKLPWPALVATAVKQWRMYGDRFVHDQTGVGAFAHDEIRAQVTNGEFSKVAGVVMGGGRERDALYTEYVAAIEHDDLRYPRIKLAYDEHRYVTPEDLYTSKGHVPDTVVSGALAWSQRRKRITLATPGGLVRSSSPWAV